jgi:hypothetical protein
MFIGNVAEIAMYSVTLHGAAADGRDYIGNEVGIGSALPAGHPNAVTPAGLPPAVPYVMRLIFALSKFMSTVYEFELDIRW